MTLEYGFIANIYFNIQRIEFVGKGIYVGINEQEKYVLIYKSPYGMRAITGDSCRVLQPINKEPVFEMEGMEEACLSQKEKELARKIWDRKLT